MREPLLSLTVPRLRRLYNLSWEATQKLMKQSSKWLWRKCCAYLTLIGLSSVHRVVVYADTCTMLWLNLNLYLPTDLS